MMRKKMTGKNHPNYGKHHSEETRKKISRGNKGTIHTVESRKNFSKGQKKRFEGKHGIMYGKKHTATARQKMSVGVRKAYANGLVPWNKGRVYSEDERKKISIATRKAMKKPEIMVKIAARPNAYKKGHVHLVRQ